MKIIQVRTLLMLYVFDNWRLQVKNLVAATTDNGLNIIAAFNILNLFRLSCLATTWTLQSIKD